MDELAIPRGTIVLDDDDNARSLNYNSLCLSVVSRFELVPQTRFSVHFDSLRHISSLSEQVSVGDGILLFSKVVVCEVLVSMEDLFSCGDDDLPGMVMLKITGMAARIREVVKIMPLVLV